MNKLDPHERLRRAASLLTMLMREQQGDPDFGLPINTYRHGLQTATRVMRAGASEELIVTALFHDVMEKMASLIRVMPPPRWL